MTITPQRNLHVAYVGPYFMWGQSLLTTKEIANSIKDRADINKSDFAIAMLVGTTSEAIAKIEFPKANLMPVKTADEALNLLIQEKVMGVIADYPFCSVAALRYRDKGLVSNPSFTMEPIGIAVRADDFLFVNMLQNLLSTLQMNGQLQGMTKGWFENSWWLRELFEERQYF
jgi:polar amino acid transport system substrate-binding protein